jgi:phosphoribosylanthranilate isomerase
VRTRIKICGITNIDDALAAIYFGADALGFVFYPPSPRYISFENAVEIIKQLPPFVTIVGLFVDETPVLVRKAIEQVDIDLLQFHGNEDEIYCEQFNHPYIKAIRMKEGLDINQSIEHYASAKALLLDTYVAGLPGGTGESFNWDLVPQKTKKPLILAGGLTVKNIAMAIQTVKPYAVDVSGGVEKNSVENGVKIKGFKDHKKIQEFIQNIGIENR